MNTPAPPSFAAHAAVAAVLAVAGAAAFTALALAFGSAPALRLTLAGVAAAALAWTVAASPVRGGRLAAAAAWSAAAVGLWHAPLTLAGYALGHAVVLWLLRCWFRYARPLAMAADFGLTLLALAAGVWASIHTGSLLLALWCHFLVLATGAWLPRAAGTAAVPGESDFRQAERMAEAALRRLNPR